MSDTFTKPSLTLDAALRAVELGRKKAEEIGVPMTIVVVDESGVIKAQVRQDAATLISVAVAERKAYTAAASGFGTQDFHDFVSGDPALAGSIPHVPGITLLGGGVPIRSGDVVIGAVGVSGGHYSQDAEVAAAAVAGVSA